MGTTNCNTESKEHTQSRVSLGEGALPWHGVSLLAFTHIYTDLQWEVGMFLLLSNLQAGQVGEAQLQLVLLFEVLHNTTIVCVPRLHGQGEPVKLREWEGE